MSVVSFGWQSAYLLAFEKDSSWLQYFACLIALVWSTAMAQQLMVQIVLAALKLAVTLIAQQNPLRYLSEGNRSSA